MGVLPLKYVVRLYSCSRQPGAKILQYLSIRLIDTALRNSSTRSIDMTKESQREDYRYIISGDLLLTVDQQKTSKIFK